MLCCHKRETDKGILRRYSRRNNGINKDSLFEQVPRNLERLVIIADKQRNDRRCRVPYLTPYATETIKGVMGNVPQMLNTFGFTFDNVECCRNSSRRCWCNTCTENVGTRVMPQRNGTQNSRPARRSGKPPRLIYSDTTTIEQRSRQFMTISNHLSGLP